MEAERIIQTKQAKRVVKKEIKGKKEKVVEETVTKGRKERKTKKTKKTKKKTMTKRLAGIIKIWTTPPTTSYGVLIFLWNKF